MLKLHTIIVTLLTGTMLIHCSKKDDSKGAMLLGLLALSDSGSSSSGLSLTPEANAAYDNSHQGIYKGQIVGSSGTWKLDVDNKGTGAQPVFVYTYTPTGSSTTYGDSLTGSISGSGPYTLNFSGTVPTLGVSFVVQVVLSATGNINSATLTVAGTSVDIRGYKEKSTALIRVYEGTASGTTVAALSSQSISIVWNLTINAEAEGMAATRILSTGGVSCSSNCEQAYPSASLNAEKKMSATSTASTCTAGCTCQTTATSNEAFELARNSFTGTWVNKVASGSNCWGAGLNVGDTVASGTLSGTRTR